MTLICTIGATEPWNAAGLGLDLRMLAELGARSVWVVAGVTAQDAGGLRASAPVAPALIDAQFDALREARIDAFRVGALLDAASIHAVARRLAAAPAPIVYDPALGPSAGGHFADAPARAAICNELIPLASVVTPNLREAASLCGFPVDGPESMAAAGRALRTFGARAALVKGGHLEGKVIDVLVDDAGTRVFEGERIAAEMRGTGCILAAALTVELARGAALRDAVGSARAFVRAKLRGALDVGGMRVSP